MRTILDERPEMRNEVEEDVSNLLDDVTGFLATVEQLGEADVDGVDFENVPEDLGDEVLAAVFGDDVLGAKGFDPALWSSRAKVSKRLGEVREIASSHLEGIPDLGQSRVRCRRPRSKPLVASSPDPTSSRQSLAAPSGSKASRVPSESKRERSVRL